MKELSEMTLEELWELFPIYLTESNPDWKGWYIEEESRLKGLLDNIGTYRIHHIGSTAIQGIWAKPTIDILLEVAKTEVLQDIKEMLIHNGYTCMSEKVDRISFNKGYTPQGFADRVFHLHLRYVGDNDELYFRDYLNNHPDIAKEYEKIKLSLWQQFEHNRDAYTDSKSAFVTQYTKQAKAEYGDRYSYFT